MELRESLQAARERFDDWRKEYADCGLLELQSSPNLRIATEVIAELVAAEMASSGEPKHVASGVIFRSNEELRQQFVDESNAHRRGVEFEKARQEHIAKLSRGEFPRVVANQEYVRIGNRVYGRGRWLDQPHPLRPVLAEAEFRAECVRLLPLLESAGIALPVANDPAARVLAWALGDRVDQQPLSNAFGLVARQIDSLQLAIEARDNRAATKRKRSTKPRKLTDIEVATMHTVGENKGNFQQAADQMNKDRKTVKNAYLRAMRKLDKTVPAKRPKKQSLPRDSRGGESLAATDDRRS